MSFGCDRIFRCIEAFGSLTMPLPGVDPFETEHGDSTEGLSGEYTLGAKLQGKTEYFVVSSANGWSYGKMTWDPSSKSHCYAIMMGEALCEQFQISCDGFDDLKIFPATQLADEQAVVLGPGIAPSGHTWLIDGRKDKVKPHALYRISLQWNEELRKKSLRTSAVHDLMEGLQCKRLKLDHEETPLARRMRQNIRFLADDALKGRKPGTFGEEVAAAFVASEMEEIGCLPAGEDGTYFQTVKMVGLTASKSDFQPFTVGRISHEVEYQLRRFQGRNVLGLISGNVAPREVVVIAGHHDHLGEQGNEIYNGAVDNCTGVAMMLATARLLKDISLGRSVLFMAPTAEECGMLGSEFYAQHPLVGGQLIQPIAAFAFDVGNVWGKTADLAILGFGKSTLDPLLMEAAESQKLRIIPDQQPKMGLFYRSDHWSFVRHGVPGVFWEVVEASDLPIKVVRHSYYIVASWTAYKPFEMVPLRKGELYESTVRIGIQDLEEFQFLRDADVLQAIYPAEKGGSHAVPVCGPDSLGRGKFWRLAGQIISA
eukprot:g15243.t2